VGLCAPLACQLLPVLNVLTHEFTQAFSALGAVALFFCSAQVALRAQGAGWARTALGAMRTGLHAGLVAGLGMGCLAFGIMALANELGPRCWFGVGAPFFWITWVPTAAFAAVAGAVVGVRRWRWWAQLLALLAALGLSLVHDGLQLLLGPHVVDFFLGLPLAFDQRADMDISQAHFCQRAFLLFCAWSLWRWARWRRGALERPGPGQRRKQRMRAFQALFSGGILALILCCARGQVGVGPGLGALHARLSEELRTEHFVIRYTPGSYAELFAQAVARDAEWHHHRICRDWGIQPEAPTRLYLFRSRDEIERFTDHRSALVILRRVYIGYWAALESTLSHELVHALHIELSPTPRVLLSRGMLEGLAMAWEHDYAHSPAAHRIEAAALAGGTLPAAQTFMALGGFEDVDEGNAYQAAGSFIGFLVQRHGFEKLRQVQRTMDFEAAYGQDLQALDAQWRSFLQQVPIDLAQAAADSEAYDAELWPGYREERCPKLRPRELLPREDARRHWKTEDWAGAFSLYHSLYQEQGKPRLAYQAAQCLRRQGRELEAVQLLDEALQDESLEVEQRFRLLQSRLASQMARQDWVGVQDSLQRRARLEQEPNVDRDMVQACLQDESLRAGVARALTVPSACTRRRLLEELLEQHPESQALRYLYVTRVFQDGADEWGLSISARDKEKVREMIAYAEQAPGAADRLAGQLLIFLDKAIRLQEYSLAQEVAQRLLAVAQDPLVQLRVRRRLDRVDWERERYGIWQGD